MSFPVATINLAAVRHNFSRVRQLAPDSKIMSVIKADAYGHGDEAVARVLADSDAYAVARLEEGISLRRQGIDKPVVLLEGVNTEAAFIEAARYQLSPVIHLHSQIELLQRIELPEPLQFNWLMIDSGMHRLGIRPEQAQAALTALQRCTNLEGEIGLMSHFANSDLVGDERNQRQLDAMLGLREQTGLPVCLANSAAVMTYPESQLDWVRPGLMLYGVSPFEDKTGIELGLEPAMQLKTRLIAVYDIHAGEEVGYGGDWLATGPARIGVASIGYGDGYNRQFSNNAEVLLRGQKAPVVGRVSMDTICLDLTGCDQVTIGDEVVLWGRPELPVENLARRANTIPYELVTVISKRVQRELTNG